MSKYDALHENMILNAKDCLYKSIEYSILHNNANFLTMIRY